MSDNSAVPASSPLEILYYSPLEILYYAVAAAGPSGGSQLEDVAPAWDVLQSYLEYEAAIGVRGSGLDGATT